MSALAFSLPALSVQADVGPSWSTERSMFQRAVPDSVRGQVTGARTALCSLGFPLGSAAGGMLLAGSPLSTAALLIAGAHLVVAVVPLFVSIARRMAVSG
ncbi:hypothetical protein [Saccharothrix sp. ALI-22-I]|uniref:hypothetical protein n=1 Tax=Saccharothrix sp. ALI-22-I TaxID=1933778 RepID=UPI000A02994A|nr:hypothetical protein [Saccharothrix sp. ALI-22-I]